MHPKNQVCDLEIAFMESACKKTAITHIEFIKNAFLKTALHCYKDCIAKDCIVKGIFLQLSAVEKSHCKDQNTPQVSG